MSKLTDSLTKNGEIQDVNNNNPFVISNSIDTWWIKQGAIDIFAIHKSNDLILQRVHLFRISANNFIFGWKNHSFEAKLTIEAVGIPETQVIKVSRKHFEHLSQQEENKKEISRCIDRWLHQTINTLFQQSILPQDYIVLNSDETLVLSHNVKILNSNNLVWFELLEGEIQWRETVITYKSLQDKYFPITHPSWIKTNTHVKIHGLTTDAIIQQEKLFSSLDFFHNQLTINLLQRCEQLQQDELNILEKTSIIDHRDLDEELYHLSAISEKKEAPLFFLSEAHDTSFNAWFAASQLVAKSLGTKLHPIEKQLTQKSLQDEILKNSKLVSRQVTLNTPKWWKKDNGALLGFMKTNNQPVALLPSLLGGCDIIDPINNTKTRLTKKTANLLQNTAYMFFKTFASEPISLNKIAQLGLTGTTKDFFRLLIMSLFIGTLGVGAPYATRILFNTVLPSNDLNQLLQVTLLLIAATIGIAIFQTINILALIRIQGKVNIAAQAAIIDRLFNLSSIFFRKYTSGDLAQRAFAADNIMRLVTGTTQSAIFGAVFALFSLIYMFIINIELSVLATILMIIGLLISGYLNYQRIIFQRENANLQGRVLNRVFQLLSGISKLRIAGAEIKAFIKWAQEFRKNVAATVKAQNIFNYLQVFNSVFILLTSFCIFSYVVLRHVPISMGDFLAFYVALGQFTWAMLEISVAIASTSNAVPLFERALPILQTLPEVDEGKLDPGILRGEIEVSHLTFRYHKDAPLVLNEINFKVSPGEFIAFVGPSSSGKSTLVRLLLGLEKPKSGAIYYDGNDLSELNVQEVRSQMGIVIQNAKLLPGDIFTNIVGSSETATLSDAWEAARLAGFDKDIKAMPMGMNTFISEGSTTISGGQRQRLLIARAMVKKPRILIFDEASSALDNLTQAIVKENLEKLNATRIIIAHRLSSIRNANRIYVIEKGKIVESGAFDELIQRQGRFAQLAQRQMLG